jgi:hypothetical protein
MKLPITSGMEKRPALKGTSVNESLEGKALKIIKANIEIEGKKMEQHVKETDISITFKVNLKAGKDKRLITRFTGNEVDMGAYYVQVLKK